MVEGTFDVVWYLSRAFEVAEHTIIVTISVAASQYLHGALAVQPAAKFLKDYSVEFSTTY